MHSLKINGILHQVDVEDEMPLLWVLRDELGMTGTKFGCGIGQCGACTVHVNGEAVRSCNFPVFAAQDKEIITIEELATIILFNELGLKNKFLNVVTVRLGKSWQPRLYYPKT